MPEGTVVRLAHPQHTAPAGRVLTPWRPLLAAPACAVLMCLVLRIFVHIVWLYAVVS